MDPDSAMACVVIDARCLESDDRNAVGDFAECGLKERRGPAHEIMRLRRSPSQPSVVKCSVCEEAGHMTMEEYELSEPSRG